MDYVDHLLAEADLAIAEMRRAARRPAPQHPPAPVAPPQRPPRAKVRDRPRDEAVAFVVGEWMAAWGLDSAAYPGLGEEMRRFTAAFCAESGVEEAVHALEAAFAAAGLDLADQMSWRSTCAHGWWRVVNPAPADAPPRPAIPPLSPGRPFWEAGCAEKCR